MAETIQGKLSVNLELKHNKTITGFNPLKGDFPLSHIVQFAAGDGTGDSQWNDEYAAQRTLAAGASETIDLAGTLENGVGNTVALTKYNLIICQLLKGGDAAPRLNISGAAANPVLTQFGGDSTSTLTIRAGDADGANGILVIQAGDITGYDITAGSADAIRIDNPSSSAATFNLVIAGNQ